MASKPLKGYKRLPGPPRRYRTPHGKLITEYEYRSRKAQRYKDSSGKSVFANYSQQRRFRRKQDFLRFRFNIRSADPSEHVDPSSEMEGALAELSRDPNFGKSGYSFDERQGRLAEILDAMGIPEYHYWRFWYSETKGQS